MVGEDGGWGAIYATATDVQAARQAVATGNPQAGWEIFENVLDNPSLEPWPVLWRSLATEYARMLGPRPGRLIADRLENLARRAVQRNDRDALSVIYAQQVINLRRSDRLADGIDTGEYALDQMLAHVAKTRWDRGAVIVAAELVPTYLRAGQHESAQRLVRRLTDEHVGQDPVLRFDVHTMLADAALQLGDFRHAAVHVHQAWQIGRDSLASTSAWPAAVNTCAGLLLRFEQPVAAKSALSMMDGVAWDDQLPDIRDLAALNTARASRILGRRGTARETLAPVCQRVLPAALTRPPDLCARTQAERGRLLAADGEPHAGIRLLGNAAPALLAVDLAGEAREAARSAATISATQSDGAERDGAQLRYAMSSRLARIAETAADRSQRRTASAATGGRVLQTAQTVQIAQRWMRRSRSDPGR